MIPKKLVTAGIIIAILGGLLYFGGVFGPMTLVVTPVKVQLFVAHGGEQLYVATTEGCPHIISPEQVTINSTLDVKFSLMASNDNLVPIANDGYFQVNHYHFRVAINGVLTDSMEFPASDTKYSKYYEPPIVLDGIAQDFNLQEYDVSQGDNITISAQVSYHSVHQEYIGDTGIPILYTEDREFDQGSYLFDIPVIGGGDDDDDHGDDDDVPTGNTWIITVKETSYSGDIIGGATVTVNGASQITGADGKTTFSNLPTGTASATVTVSGFDTKIITTKFNGATGTNEDTAVMIKSSPGPGPGGDEYAWTTMGYFAVLIGIIAAAVVYAVAPLPPKVKGFVAIALAFGGLILAHLINTGAVTI